MYSPTLDDRAGSEISAAVEPCSDREDNIVVVVANRLPWNDRMVRPSGDAAQAGWSTRWSPSSGTQHNFRNTGDEPLVLYTVCSPPAHAIDASYATKLDADAAEAAGRDNPPTTV